jgi:hypothetical protein
MDRSRSPRAAARWTSCSPDAALQVGGPQFAAVGSGIGEQAQDVIPGLLVRRDG